MDEIMTTHVTSISEFKKNPNAEVKKAGNKPFAVLTNNKVGFYVMSPELFDRVTDILDDAALVKIVEERIKDGTEGVVVNLEDL
jgi:PHD/YefM family antitoxin component YafN of YafNO toxin-antitoxin module